MATETFPMMTDLPGLLTLLAEHLYSDPDVFVRELLQNSHDALMSRRMHQPDIAGRIDVTCDPRTRVITFRDNGIGMDRDDIKRFLSVIGSSSKRDARGRVEELRQQAEEDLIGQFGIGILSAFLVAAPVTVRTRRFDSDETFEWRNSGSIDCELTAIPAESIGTEVELRIKEDFAHVLNDEFLRASIVKYCDFLPFPVYLNDRGPVNAQAAPWHRSDWPSAKARDVAYSEFLNRHYQDIQLLVIPVDIPGKYRAAGALYITDRRVLDANANGTMGSVDIYVKRMFIRTGDTALLPPWAQFVRGIIDSPDLKPTAARDNIKIDEAFAAIQERLGDLIIQSLMQLADQNPVLFRQICRYHHVQLKGMALKHDDFFERVVEQLLFDTNKGQHTLPQLLGHNPPTKVSGGKSPIYYYSLEGASGQFNQLADAKGWTIVNAGAIYDEELLIKYARRNGQRIHLERIDTSDNPELFGRIEPHEEEQYRQLELEILGRLNRAGVVPVEVHTRRYEPSSLPSVLLRTPLDRDQAAFERMRELPGFFPGVADIIEDASATRRRQPVKLLLNAQNPLVQKLAGPTRLLELERAVDSRNALVGEVIIGLFYSAFLCSRDLLTNANAAIIHSHLLQLAEGTLQRLEILGDVTNEVRKLRVEKGPDACTSEQTEHVSIFVIAPFEDEYKNVEEAIKRVFERPPYYFQVQLARDFHFEPELLPNVREHMLRSHAFLAEVSDLNANVMFELGAVMQSVNERPVFALRSSVARKAVPVDLRQNLFLQYGSPSDSVEIIEAALRDHFERDGRLVNADILALLERRRKRFLSRRLLESLIVHLPKQSIDALLGRFNTVEDLLQESDQRLIAVSGLKSFVVAALRGQLTEEGGEP